MQLILALVVVAVQAASGIWLDKPLAPWNVAGAALPKPPARAATGNDTIESREALDETLRPESGPRES